MSKNMSKYDKMSKSELIKEAEKVYKLRYAGTKFADDDYKNSMSNFRNETISKMRFILNGIAYLGSKELDDYVEYHQQKCLSHGAFNMKQN